MIISENFNQKDWTAAICAAFICGHLREISPVFPADFRRYSHWLPLIRQIISKLIFPSAAICAAFICGHLREIFPVFPADFRRYSRWLPLIKQIISKLIFTSAVICAALICGHLREIFPVFPSMVNGYLVNGQWWMVNGENSVILLFLKHNANPTSTLSVFS